jgi:glutathione-regulated potassium-efflux system ancillary protein KefC
MNSLATVTALLAAAVLFVPLFRKLGLGSVLGYLVAGVLIGPSVSGVVHEPEAILHTAEFGVALLMFLVGLELQRERLWALRASVFGLGALQFFTCGAALAGAAFAFGLSVSAALIVGVALTMTSTAFMLPALAERNELDSTYGREAFAVSLFQDLSVIPILAAVALLGAPADGTTAPGWPALVTLVAVVALGRPVLHLLFRFASKFGTHEIFTAAALLTTVGLAWLMTKVGLSATLGAFVAGVLLADSEFRHELEASIEPFETLLLGLFFMAVGMSMNLKLLAEKPALILSLALGILAIKAIVFYLARRFITRAADAIARPQALALAVGGEFAFVLFSAAQASRILSASEAEILNIAVVLTMVFAPLLWILNDRVLSPWLERGEADAPFDRIDDPATPVIIAGYGRVGQIVGRIMNMRNIPFTALDASSDAVDSVRKFGNKIYYGDATRLDLLRSAKAQDAKVLVVCVDEMEAALTIVRNAKKHFPNLKIYARARNRTHLLELRELGVEHIERETFAGSVALAREVLGALEPDAARVAATVATFVEHDENLLDKQEAIFRDEKRLIDVSKTARAELKSILEEDARVENRAGNLAPEDRAKSLV